MDRYTVDEDLHKLMLAHRKTARQYFYSCGLFNGHPPVLFLLRNQPGMTLKQLASSLSVSPASASVSLRRMETAGLIERRPDDSDRRVVRFYLTVQGEEVDSRCHRGREFFVEHQFRNMSDQDLQELSRLLRIMTDNLQQASDELPPEGREPSTFEREE